MKRLIQTSTHRKVHLILLQSNFLYIKNTIQSLVVVEGFSTLLYGPFTQKVSSKVIQSHFMHIIKVKFAINNPTCSQLLVKKNLEGALFSLLLFRRFAKNNQNFCLLFHLVTVRNQKMLQIRSCAF